MKANELMYGDWIMFPDENNKQVQVEALNLISIGYYGEGEHHFVPIERAAPIPLTKEILKKNGFYEYISIEGESIWSRGGVEITIFEGGNVCETINICEYELCKCPYIHTLQHILRLNGLYDLADNFKI